MALGAVIAVHHSVIASSMDHGTSMGMGAVSEMCPGVLAAVGAAVVAVAIGVLTPGRWRLPLSRVAAVVRLAARVPAVRVRDAPPCLSCCAFVGVDPGVIDGAPVRARCERLL